MLLLAGVGSARAQFRRTLARLSIVVQSDAIQQHLGAPLQQVESDKRFTEPIRTAVSFVERAFRTFLGQEWKDPIRTLELGYTHPPLKQLDPHL